MQGLPDRHSYRVSRGKATLSKVTLIEMAAALGLRSNSRKLKAMLAEERAERDLNCVTAALLMLKLEHERLGLSFEMISYESVATIFWHAYAKIGDAIEFVGDTSSLPRIQKNLGTRARLADQLTGNPSIHRFIYRDASGVVRTALDRASLRCCSDIPAAVIDLETLAQQLFNRMGRPLLRLNLYSPRAASTKRRAAQVRSAPACLAA